MVYKGVPGGVVDYWVLGTGEEEEEEGVCLVLCFGAALFVLPSLLSGTHVSISWLSFFGAVGGCPAPF